jgi:hypothetical protein
VLALKLPSGWQANNTSEAYQYFVGTDVAHFVASLYIVIGNADAIYKGQLGLNTIPQTPQDGLTAYTQSLSPNSFTSGSVQAAKVGPVDGYSVRLSNSSGYKQEYEVYLAVLPDSRLIVIWATAQSDVWQLAQPALQTIVDSIVIHDRTFATPPSPTLAP